MLVAADHTARGFLRAGSDGLAMADRFRLLERLSVALSRPGVDGVLGTADIIEDLLLMGALEGKVVIGSMNRGGLAGTVFEIDDRFTGYDADAVAPDGLPGRQDADAHRPRGPRDRSHRGRLRGRRRRPRRARPDGHGRALHLPPRRGPGPQRPVHRGRGAVRDRGRRARLDQCPHLAEDARDRRHGAGPGRDHASRAAARRRGRGRTRTRSSRPGRRCWATPRCAAWSSVARCSTRRTATSPPPWTPWWG